MGKRVKKQWLTTRTISLFMLFIFVLLQPFISFADGTNLDLSNRYLKNADDIASLILSAGEIATVDLSGVEIDSGDRKALIEKFPDIHFIWSMRVWDADVSSEDTEITFEGKRAGNLTELCDTLDCLPNIKSVYMWNIRLTREERDKLYFGYPDVFFGWEIHMNSTHCIRTDATAFSTLSKSPGLHAFNMWNFVYCPYLLALDVGHNTIKNLDFLAACNKFKILIAVDAKISDISPIACQTDLEYVELFLNDITDISPLANLVNLRDVNLAFNDISDLSPLYELPHLERVWLMMNKNLTEEEIARLQEHQPDCEIVTRSYGSTGNVMLEDGTQLQGTSWRHHSHYNTIYYIFHTGNYVDWSADVPSRYE